ncbi:MAG: serine/threonine-protein kinase [Gemmataceae bacterium]
MATVASSEKLITTLRKCSLLTDQQIDDILARLPPDADNERVARRFVKAGLLTPFQVRCLSQGKWRNLILGDKYKILDHLGDGGMGQVYLAEHLLMKRRVALKVPPSKKLKDPGMVQRFIREARALASLDHPNIVRAHDIEKIGDVYMLAMEYVDGPNLRDYVTEHGPRPIGQACHYIAQAAQGLQHAHEAGWVHRDIKPANLLVDTSGVVKVLDLGLAFLLGDDADSPTRQFDENSVLGTADYLAPEQAINSHEVDIRADIYSLGATLYFLLTGKLMFECSTVAQKLVCHQMKQPKPVCELRPEVPTWLGAVIAKMIEKDPADRYQTPAEVAKALVPFASDKDLIPPARSGRTGTGRKTNETTLASTLNARSRSNDVTHSDITQIIARHPRAITAAAAATAAAALIGVVGVAWLAFGGRSPRAAAGAAVGPAGPDTVAVAGERTVIRAHQGLAECVRVLPDGRFITAGDDWAIRLWGADGKFLKQFDGHSATVRAVTLLPTDGGKMLSASRDGTARIWDIATGAELKKYEGHSGQLWWVDASPDGKSILTCGQDKAVRLWDRQSGNVLQVMEGHTETATCAVFVSGGKRAVSCSTDKTVRLWDLETGTELRRLGLPDKGYRITLSPDASKAVVASRSTVLAWDVESGKSIGFASTTERNGYIEQARYSPDGKWLLAGGSDGIVRLWNASTTRELPPIRGIRGKILEVDWSRDGKSFAAACADGSVRIWDWTRLN